MMDRLQLDRLLSDALVFGQSGYVVKYTGPISSVGPEIGRVDRVSLIETIPLGEPRSRPRALRYSGAWAPRSRTTPGALRVTMRRTYGRIGPRAWTKWP